MGETRSGALGRPLTTHLTYRGLILCLDSYALYSSLSPGFQKYLEGLTAVHSAVAQAEGARAAGLHVRRQEIETIHPVVRVHPVTGWKSVYVNQGKLMSGTESLIYDPCNCLIGFTRRIVGIPKAESDFVLQFLFHQISENPDFQVRFHWEPKSVAFWDNRVSDYFATTGLSNFIHIGGHPLRNIRLLAVPSSCSSSYSSR
jgi:sulfonate dioxygenase